MLTKGDEASFDAFNNPRKIPKWLDHFNARDLKNLFKCSLAVWVLTLLIFIDDTMRLLGQAGFFGCIVLFIVPPSGVVFIQILVGIIICVGLALGWAWGVITMKAALATRPTAEVMQRFQQLQQSMPQNTTNAEQATGQGDYTQIAIYDGFMLDTRVTVTYFCMMGLFVYFVARLRVAAPNLALVTIFSLVVADIYLTMAPLIPTFEGTIPKVLITPTAIAVGIGAVSNLLLFPQSTSGIILDNFKDVLSPMKGYLGALGWHLKNRDAKFDMERLKQLKGDLAAASKSVESAIKFLPMDFSYRKWSPEDITSLHEPLRQILVSFGDLLLLSMSWEELVTKDDALTKAATALEDSDSDQQPVAYHIARAADLREATIHPDTDEMISKTMNTLSHCAKPMLRAFDQAIEATIQALSGASQQDTVAEHELTLKSLKEAQAEFEESAASHLMAPHAHLFDAKGRVIYAERRAPPFFGLMIGLLYQERITNFSKDIQVILEKAIEVENARHRNRLWMPEGIQRIFSWGLSQDEPPTTTHGTLNLTRAKSTISRLEKRRGLFSRKPEEKAEPQVDNSAAALLQSMQKPSSRQRSKPSLVCLALIDFFFGVEGLHALRTLVLTIALAIPAAIPSSAGFYFREKGLWALVMAQLALEPFISDFVSGVIIRSFGTVLGGFLGLVCWYVGAGSGPGNAYGLAAIMTVAIVVMMWWRLFAPPEHIAAGIMLTSTMYMVISYSWIDTHIPSYGNPGVGYTVFWRRMLLVLIGFLAATLTALFPRPLSGNRHYRHILSDQLSSIRDRYALLATTWRSPPDDLVEVIEKKAASSEELLSSIIEPIRKTRYEFSTSSIDAETLSRSNHLCDNLNIYITQLVVYVAKLPLPVRTQFMHRMSAGDENLIADLMSTLTLVQHTLVSGEPLPAILPTPLVRRAMQFRKLRGELQADLNAKKYLAEREGRQWVAAINAFVRFLGTVDELVVVVKRAVGERSFIDIEALDRSV